MALVQSAAPVPPPSHLSAASSKFEDPIVPASATRTESSIPVTPSGHQRQMSFQMSSFNAPPNPYQVPPNYAPANGSQTPQPPHVVGKDISDIYIAVYSGISVYEMMVNSVNVMRRRKDSWLNATQILKVAGVEKGKRTKVLEKEILPGKHEKVQGGYGKYQGTWIEYERGRDFCRQYGVEDLLRPLLEYDMGQDGQSKGTMDTPTKEQAMAAQRKKKLSENRMATQSPNGTFFKNISTSAANAVQAINKARFESPASRPGSAQKPRPSLGRSLSQQKSSQESFQPSSQHSMHSIHSDHSLANNGQLDGSFGAVPNPYLGQTKRPASGLGHHEPPRKRMRSVSSSNTITPGMNGFSGPSFAVNPEQSAMNSHAQHEEALGVPPLPQPISSSAQKKQASLLSLVMMNEDEDFSNHATFNEVTGQDLDIPMDNTAHTALIWAATLGRLSLVRKLVASGANIYRVNVGGETALMRAASAVNNFERGNFPELLEILGPTIEMRDGRGRTVLHHIAIASAIKGRSRACKYYLESLLEFVVRQGSGTGSSGSSQTLETNGMQSNGQLHKHRTIGLARFMSDIVNTQDISGDTALNMAARNGNRALAQQLLEVGADASIANNGGLKPTDFGVEGVSGEAAAHLDALRQPNSNSESTGSMAPPPAKKLGNKVAETGVELLNSMQSIIEDAKASYLAEARAKQALIDEARAKLNAARERVTAEQTRRNELKRRKDARDDLKTQILNLRRANGESSREIVEQTHSSPKSQVKVGDADAGLWIDAALLPAPREKPQVNGINGDAMDVDGHANELDGEGERVETHSLTPEQLRYATSTLSQSHFIRARSAAYQANNDNLRLAIDTLAQRSSRLESQTRKILCLSLGVPEDRIEDMVPGLIVAIDSEQGEVDVERIREFLRRVEEDTGSDID